MTNHVKDYLSPAEASKLTHCDVSTLRHWANKGHLRVRRTPGGRRFYYVPDLKKLFVTIKDNQNQKASDKNLEREIIGYVRVSSDKERPNLDRQIEYIRGYYPEIQIYSDVGSGLDFGRKGLEGFLDHISRTNVQTAVVTRKDRLCRHGFELVERILQQNNTELLVLCGEDHFSGDQDEGELSRDIVGICNTLISQYGEPRTEKRRKVHTFPDFSDNKGEKGKDIESAPDSSSS
jgi:predicted site-specific integrase-resolvase